MPDAPIPNTPETNKVNTAASHGTPSQLDGTTTIDAGMSFEVELAAYESVAQAARRIRRHIDPRIAQAAGELRPTIVFLERPPGEFIEASDMFTAQLGNLSASFDSVTNVAASALGALADVASDAVPFGIDPGGVLAGATSLLGLLRADVTYSGRKVAIDPLALALELARQWEDDPNVLFLDPRFSLPRDHWLQRSWEVDVLAPLDKVTGSRERAFQSIHALSQAFYRLPEGASGMPAARFSLDYARDHFEQSDRIFRALQTRLNGGGEQTGATLLHAIRMGAMIRSGAERPDTRFLFAKVVASGGSYRTVRHLIRMLFFGDGAYYSGGVIVAYALSSDTGRIKSGVMGERTAYRSVFDWVRAWRNFWHAKK